MYEYSPLGEIFLQITNNGNSKFTRCFQQKMKDSFHGSQFIRE